MECRIDHDLPLSIKREWCRACNPSPLNPTATQVKDRIAKSFRNAKVTDVATDFVNQTFEIANRLGLLPLAGPNDNRDLLASSSRPASSSKASQ